MREDGSQALVNLVVTRTHANTHGFHIHLRGLNAQARYRLAEQVIEGCEAPDGTYLGGMDLTGRVFTGASLMVAGFTLRPMRGDAPAAQLLFEQTDAEEM